MALLWLPKRPRRSGMLLPLGGTRENPNLIIPFYKGMERQEVRYIAEMSLGRHGLSDAEINAVLERAEKEYEQRVKVHEANAELDMRIAEQARYPHLKWGGLPPVRKRNKHLAWM